MVNLLLLQCPMHAKSLCTFAQAVHRHRKGGKVVHTRGLPQRREYYSYVTLRKTTPVFQFYQSEPAAFYTCVDLQSIALETPPHQRVGWVGKGIWVWDDAVCRSCLEGRAYRLS